MIRPMSRQARIEAQVARITGPVLVEGREIVVRAYRLMQGSAIDVRF